MLVDSFVYFLWKLISVITERARIGLFLLKRIRARPLQRSLKMWTFTWGGDLAREALGIEVKL